MSRKTCALVLTTMVLAIACLNALSSIVDDNDCTAVKPQTTGPDVIVGIIGQQDGSDITNWGTVGDITAFSFATTSCNKGNQPLNWIRTTPDHPVISQNLFRLTTATTDTSTGETVSRFEQIGMAWLKHGFFATNQQDCCTDCNPPGGSGQALRPLCSDLYVSSLNGGAFGVGRSLGPRSAVNAASGVFPFPFSLPTNPSVIDRRLQVHRGDVLPAAQARYFLEGQYVTRDDAAAGNANNNASYREALLTNNTSGVQMTMTPGSTTITAQAAINAWKAAVPQVSLLSVDVPNDGRLIVALNSTRLQGNIFHHEIAVHNLNSDRSVQSIQLNHAQAGTISRPGFHAPEYHSGEPYANTPWAPVINSASIQWSTDSFVSNANANALRWGTCYSFNYESDTVPASLVLTLFKPGQPAQVQQDLRNVTPGNPLDTRQLLARNWATLPQALNLGEISTDGNTVHIPHAPGKHEEIRAVESSDAQITVTASSAYSGKVNGWNLQIRPSKDAKADQSYFETMLTLYPASEDKQPLRVRAFGSLK